MDDDGIGGLVDVGDVAAEAPGVADDDPQPGITDQPVGERPLDRPAQIEAEIAEADDDGNDDNDLDRTSEPPQESHSVSLDVTRSPLSVVPDE